MTETAGTATVFTIAKNMSYVAAFFAYLSINPETVWILGFLMIFDTITGVIRTIIIHGGRSFKSHELEIGIMKKFLFLSIPFIMVLTAKGTGHDIGNIPEIGFTLLILSETYSIMSNIYSIHIRKDVVEFDAMAFILSRIRDILEKLIKK